jgi:hypothetical protein
MLRISIGIYLSNQLPASVYCIQYSKLFVKKKIGGAFSEKFDMIIKGRRLHDGAGKDEWI